MKFEKDEIAITTRESVSGVTPLLGKGEEVVIFAVGPFAAGEFIDPEGFYNRRDSDYCIYARGRYRFCLENFLRKRRDPIPDEVLTIFETRKREETA